jgi:hypothetical protein
LALKKLFLGKHYQNFFFGKKADMPEDFFSCLVDENLGWDELNAILSAGLWVFPDIIENNLDFLGVFGRNFSHDRLHGPAGNAAVSADLDESDLVLGEVKVEIVGHDYVASR